MWFWLDKTPRGPHFKNVIVLKTVLMALLDFEVDTGAEKKLLNHTPLFEIFFLFLFLFLILVLIFFCLSISICKVGPYNNSWSRAWVLNVLHVLSIKDG